MRTGGFLQAFFAAQPRCTLRARGEAASDADVIQHSQRTCQRQSGRYALAVTLALLSPLGVRSSTPPAAMPPAELDASIRAHEEHSLRLRDHHRLVSPGTAVKELPVNRRHDIEQSLER
jgi:hypothetical protein